MAGHSRIETQAAKIDSSQVLVAMWFDDSMAEVYEVGIEPAERDAGHEPRLNSRAITSRLAAGGCLELETWVGPSSDCAATVGMGTERLEFRLCPYLRLRRPCTTSTRGLFVVLDRLPRRIPAHDCGSPECPISQIYWKSAQEGKMARRLLTVALAGIAVFSLAATAAAGSGHSGPSPPSDTTTPSLSLQTRPLPAVRSKV